MTQRGNKNIRELQAFCKTKGLPRPVRLWGGGRVHYRMPERVVVAKEPAQ